MNPSESDKKNQKRNIVLMIVLAVILAIGILSRWRYVVQEIRQSVENYLPPADSTKVRK